MSESVVTRVSEKEKMGYQGITIHAMRVAVALHGRVMACDETTLPYIDINTNVFVYVLICGPTTCRATRFLVSGGGSGGERGREGKGKGRKGT